MKPFFTSALLHCLIIMGAWNFHPTNKTIRAPKENATPLIEVTFIRSRPAQTLIENKHLSEKVGKAKTRPTPVSRKVRKRPSQRVALPTPTPSSAPTEPSFAKEGLSQAVRLTYVQALNAFISQHQHYPRRARRLKQTGTIEVRFRVTSEGEFEHIHIHQGCSHQTLNQAAVKLIEKLGRFKPLPKTLGSSQNFVVPIQYRIRGGS